MTLFGAHFTWHKPKLTAWQWQVFYQYLSRLLTAGLPLVDALHLLVEHGVDQRQRDLSRALAVSVLRGSSFTEAAYSSQLFAPLDVSLLEVGELSGRLPSILTVLVNHHARQHRLMADFKKAMAYPLLIVLMSGLMLMLMLGWVVPQFSRFFQAAGAPLPWLTRVVMRLSEAALTMSLSVGIVSILCWVLVQSLWLYRRDWFEWALQRIPMIGKMWQLNVWHRVCQTLGLMLQAGVPLLTALPISAAAANSEYGYSALFMINRDIQQGLSLHQAFVKQAFFPPVLSLLIAIGENTGRLDEVLLHQAESFEQQLTLSAEQLNRRLEPLMMTIVGALVGVIVIAMYLPIFDMGKFV